MALNLHEYFVSETLGFLLEKPLERLPSYFEPWNRLAADMYRLVANGTMQQHTLQLELLDWTQLEGHRQKRLAHFQLILITAGYVWQNGEKQAAKVLPACVAVPLCALSEDLGLPPIITHADLALANYAIVDPDQPLGLNNMRALYELPGEKESEWFALVAVAVELEFAKGIKSVLGVLEGVKNQDVQSVTSHVTHLCHVVNNMQHALSQSHEKLTSETFFNIMRPFLSGWGGEDNPLPEGLIYEGVSDKPVKAIGGSAAQSGTMQVLDALMGVQHSPDKRSFLLEMRSYMLPGHREFINALENRPENLPDMVKSSGSEELSRAYDDLLSAMVDFRSYHIKIVTKYIVGPSSKAKRHDNKFESLDKKGTGGTSILPFLKELRQDTTDIMTTKTACSN